MATRRETAQRRVALNESLRAACEQGIWKPGEMLPPVRELAFQHSVSMKVVCEALAALVEEGVLYTVPRVGTFIGRPPGENSEPYLFISHSLKVTAGFTEQLRIGFEERIALLGGACLSLSQDEARWHIKQDNLPRFSGVFELGFSELGGQLTNSGTPCVLFGGPSTSDRPLDRVDFDNENGGALATRHLLNMGYRCIAFLALHHNETETQLEWSIEREKGWWRAMTQANGAVEDMVFRPDRALPVEARNHKYAAQEMARSILERPEITAVVAVNAYAAEGIMDALRKSEISINRWPAIVCFDQAPESKASIVSYLRLPWEKVGSEAAQLLWERKTGRLNSPPQHKLVPMQLIPRLTCRSDWATISPLAKGLVTGKPAIAQNK